MAKKRVKPEQIETLLQQIEVAVANGIRTRVYSPPRASCTRLSIYVMLTQQPISGDLNSVSNFKPSPT
jgi:hypothetical protein